MNFISRADDPEGDALEIAFMKKEEIFESLTLPLTAGKNVLGLLEIYEPATQTVFIDITDRKRSVEEKENSKGSSARPGKKISFLPKSWI